MNDENEKISEWIERIKLNSNGRYAFQYIGRYSS